MKIYSTLAKAVLAVVVFNLIAPPMPVAAEIYSRIINGSEAPTGQWPFMAGLYWSPKGGTSQSFQCGGAVIDPYHILTAAHCVTDDAGRKYRASQLSVRTGSIDLYSPGAAQSTVSEVFVHPSYRSATFRNDIAVLRLTEAVSAEEVLTTYPSHGALVAEGMSGTILGWGSTDPEISFSVDTLREAVIQFGSTTECAETFGSIFAPESMICAGILSTYGHGEDREVEVARAVCGV